LSCHIPPVFFQSGRTSQGLSIFQAQKNPEAFIAGSGWGNSQNQI